MAKGKKSSEEPRSPPWTPPRNTVTLCLDGTEAEVLANFDASQRYFRYWFFTTAAYRYRVEDRLLFTTPLSGTFYYMIEHAGQYIVFVIAARQYWLVGFINDHGFWESEWEDVVGFYMRSSRTRSIDMGANHGDVADERGGVENTRMGVFPLREAFIALASYKGPKSKSGEPHGFRDGIGRWIVYLMETKFWTILNRSRVSMVTYTYPRLGPGTKRLVNGWSTRCKTIMRGIEDGFESEEEMAEAMSFLAEVLIYYIDAHKDAKHEFKHALLPPKPRFDTWEEIDQGEGHRLIPNPDAVSSKPESRPRYAKNRAGCKRGNNSLVEDEKVQKRSKREGLRGGGVGGPADVPKWFLHWDQEMNDKGRLDELIRRSRAVGLHIGEAHFRLKDKPQDTNEKDQQDTCKPSLGLEAESEDNIDSSMLMQREQSTPTCQAGQYPSSTHLPAQQRLPVPTISPEDIEDLQCNNFISDTVISTYYDNLAQTMSDDSIYLVPPSISNGFSWAPSDNTIDIAYLASRRLTIFPVNNGIPDQADSGLHWSLVVLDATNVASPRLIHHDSSELVINRDAAQRLADALRQVLPFQLGDLIEGLTPVQQTGYDCAIYALAITTCITNWLRRNVESEPTWIPDVLTHVTSMSVTRMRELLPGFFHNDMSIQDLIYNCFAHKEDQSMASQDYDGDQSMSDGDS